MGCCTSTGRVKRPIRTRDLVLPAHHIASMPDVIEEDEKNDEKQIVITNHRNYTESDSDQPAEKSATGEVEMKQSQKKEEEKSLILSRRVSIFNLYKDYGENILDRSIRPSRQVSGIDMRRSRLQTEESVFKLTPQQHEELLRFVDERVRSFHIETLRIYDNLCKNSISEHEDLLLFLEDLRLNDKDIQNCVEDLLSYPFPNDTEYIAALNAKNLLVKKLILEYSSYQKNSNYKETRNRMLKILLLYDPDLPNIKFSSLDLAVVKLHKSSSKAYRQVENSVVFVPKEEKNWRIEENQRDDLQDIDFNFALNQVDSGSRVADFKYEVLKSVQDGEKQEEQEAMAKYYGLVDELDGLNDGLKNLQESWKMVQVEVHEYKKMKNMEGDSDSADKNRQLQNVRRMEENMQRESEVLGRKYIELQGQLKKLKTKLNESLKEQKEAMDFDYDGKLNDLGYQLDRKLKELIDLTLTMPMVFRDIEPQKREVSPIFEKENSHISEPPLTLSPLREKSMNLVFEEERNNETEKMMHSLKSLSKEMRIGGPKTLTSDSIKNLSSVLKGDVNDDVSVSEHELNEISLPVSQKKQKYREYAGTSYGLSHSTTVNSRENQNTLSQIDNTELYFSNGQRVY